jgi:hypothetical protein
MTSFLVSLQRSAQKHVHEQLYLEDTVLISPILEGQAYCVQLLCRVKNPHHPPA